MAVPQLQRRLRKQPSASHGPCRSARKNDERPLRPPLAFPSAVAKQNLRWLFAERGLRFTSEWKKSLEDSGLSAALFMRYIAWYSGCQESVWCLVKHPTHLEEKHVHVQQVTGSK